MCGDRSVLLCVVCFIGGLVIRCVVSVTWYCESEIVRTLACCMLEVRCGYAGVVSGLQAKTRLVFSCSMWALGFSGRLT